MRIINLKSLSAVTILTLTSISMPAMAGFEFMPPLQTQTQAQMPDPIPSVSTPPMMDNTMMGTSMIENVAPMRVSPVIAVPIDPITAVNMPVNSAPQNIAPIPASTALPTPTMPQENPNKIMSAVVPTPVMVQKSGGLVIDPYPLRANKTAPVNNYKVSQAIGEKAGGLHPVQLGGGMTTGVNMDGKRTRIAAVSMNTKAKSPSPISISALTPMLGDNPAPLPGYGYDDVERQPMRQYAQAVGFGKNLPMALAISQVIPPEFTHRFEGEVDASMMVDWDGGKPWNLVLEDMLRKQNMTSEIQGNVVVIKQTAKI